VNINNKTILILLMTVVLCQFQPVSSKEKNVNSIDDEEIPAIDPFAGGMVGSSANQTSQADNKLNSNNGLLNNMRLVGTIIGKNKKIAIFSSADGTAFKFQENQAITSTTFLKEIFNDVVIVQDEANNMFEVYMNNIIKPSKG